jgi:hypothetical protein
MPELNFHERLQSHVGGLVRVVSGQGASNYNVIGKIGLLMDVEVRCSAVVARVALLIDGRVIGLYVYSSDLELIMSSGAVDA